MALGHMDASYIALSSTLSMSLMPILLFSAITAHSLLLYTALETEVATQRGTQVKGGQKEHLKVHCVYLLKKKTIHYMAKSLCTP